MNVVCMPMRRCTLSKAESKIQAQGAALRRALADELREYVRTSLGPRIDRALNDALRNMEDAVCSGVDRMNAEVSRSSGIVAEMADRHEQVGSRGACSCAPLNLPRQMLAELSEFASERSTCHASRSLKVRHGFPRLRAFQVNALSSRSPKRIRRVMNSAGWLFAQSGIPAQPVPQLTRFPAQPHCRPALRGCVLFCPWKQRCRASVLAVFTASPRRRVFWVAAYDWPGSNPVSRTAAGL